MFLLAPLDYYGEGHISQHRISYQNGLSVANQIAQGGLKIRSQSSLKGRRALHVEGHALSDSRGLLQLQTDVIAEHLKKVLQ